MLNNYKKLIVITSCVFTLWRHTPPRAATHTSVPSSVIVTIPSTRSPICPRTWPFILPGQRTAFAEYCSFTTILWNIYSYLLILFIVINIAPLTCRHNVLNYGDYDTVNGYKIIIYYFAQHRYMWFSIY